MVRAIGQARAVIRAFRPDVIFATGGYVSAPVIWAAAAERIPRVIYLPDLEPGWAIQVTSHWATRVAVSFPEVKRFFPAHRVVVTGYPVRARFFRAECARARQHFSLDLDLPTITVLGGSRGAHQINAAIVGQFAELARAAQLIHITGQADEEWVKSELMGLSAELRSRVKVFGYLDEELPDALAAANIVVARAGAATLGEFPALGLPAILIPYPYAGRHQEMNASFMVNAGAAIRIDDSRAIEELPRLIKELLASPEQLAHMRAASRSLAQPQAARRLGELLRTLAGTSA